MIPTLAQFKEDVSRIYPEGDLFQAYDLLKWNYINTPDFKNDEEGIYSLVLNKFSEHVNAWKKQHGGKEEKYLSAEVRKDLKNIYDFLKNYMWRREYIGLQASKPRDAYLFPSSDMKALKVKLDTFKSKHGIG